LAESKKQAEQELAAAKAAHAEKLEQALAESKKQAEQELAAAEAAHEKALAESKEQAEQELADLKIKTEEQISSTNAKFNKVEAFCLSKLFESMHLCVENAQKQCVNENWSNYLAQLHDDIVDQMEVGIGFDDIILKLYKPDSWMTKVASLEWWITQPELKEIVSKNINGLSELLRYFDLAVQFLNLIDQKVALPIGEFGESIDNYKPYPYGKPRLKNLFPEYVTSTGVLCEIYDLARNGKPGECFLLV
jgi:hypothetical protein